MVVMRRMSVDSMMMVVVMMMRTSDSSLLWRAGVGREAKRVEGSSGVLFRQAMVVMVMTRGSCQYQHGRLRSALGSLTDEHGRDGGGDALEDEPSLVVCYLSDWRLEYFCRPHYRCPPVCLPSAES